VLHDYALYKSTFTLLLYFTRGVTVGHKSRLGKTEIPWLLNGENRMILRLLTLPQYQRVTDRRTRRR